MVNGHKHGSNLNGSAFTIFIDNIQGILVILKILRLFVNTFFADDMYSLLNRDNPTQPIRIQLSQKQKTFSQFISEVLKFRLTFEHFRKKYDTHS